MSVAKRIQPFFDQPIQQMQPLSGGMIGEVYKVTLANRQVVVAKVGTPSARLDIEGYMLRYLAENSRLPVPTVLHSDETLLIMSFIDGQSHLGTAEQQHAADLLADLHTITQQQFGLDRDTLIGPLPQPNQLTTSWIDFFRDQRLLYMAHEAHTNGPLSAHMLARLEHFSTHLNDWLIEPDQPALIHGDIWTTNVLTNKGKVTGFLDPAIYYGHAEIELAYTTMFGTFGRTFDSAFFERYRHLRPIEPGFFETRRHIYNLYPLLVHLRLFGLQYASPIDETLREFGF